MIMHFATEQGVLKLFLKKSISTQLIGQQSDLFVSYKVQKLGEHPLNVMTP